MANKDGGDGCGCVFLVLVIGFGIVAGPVGIMIMVVIGVFMKIFGIGENSEVKNYKEPKYLIKENYWPSKGNIYRKYIREHKISHIDTQIYDLIKNPSVINDLSIGDRVEINIKEDGSDVKIPVLKDSLKLGSLNKAISKELLENYDDNIQYLTFINNIELEKGSANIYIRINKIDLEGLIKKIKEIVSENTPKDKKVKKVVYNNSKMLINRYERKINSDGIDSMSFENIFELGELYIDSQKFDKAVDYYNGLITEFPELKHEFRMKLAEIYKKSNEYEKAVFNVICCNIYNKKKIIKLLSSDNIRLLLYIDNLLEKSKENISISAIQNIITSIKMEDFDENELKIKLDNLFIK